MSSELDLADRLGRDTGEAIVITWLGQAGFALQYRRTLVLIDPYLSDSLAAKYSGTTYPHVRLAPVPVDPSKLTTTALFLSSHRHTDHMDPVTMDAVAAASRCRFVVPEAWVKRVVGFGIDPARVTGAVEESRLEIDGIGITPVLAAHETLERDQDGQSLFLGYVLEIGGRTIYHSGDCAPFQGQVETLIPLNVETALLPVNGRDAMRLTNGVPGNFWPAEASNLAVGMGAKVLIAHHFGMFDFNTIDPQLLDEVIAGAPPQLTVLKLGIGESYCLPSSVRTNDA